MSESPASILYDSAGNELKGQKAMTASVPVVVASDQVAVPVSATSLPLPTGAATAVKQPAIGTAGAPSADVISIQGVSGGTAVPVTGSFSSSVIPNPDDVTGTITATNGNVTATVEGWSSCAVVLTGTWQSVILFEMSHDGGTTWTGGGFVASPSGIGLSAPLPLLKMLATANGSYQTIGMGATTNVRVRSAVHYSGTVEVRLIFGNALPPMLTAFTATHQNVMASVYNNSTTNLAAGAAFTGTVESTLGTAGIRIAVMADQPILVQLQQSLNGTDWDISDNQTFMANEGDGRIFQAVANYYRVVATNLGGATTTYFRLSSVHCPMVEAVPRALTPNGRLRLASRTTSWAPDPYNHQARDEHRALLMDLDRNLNVRARCLTDEASFRDDFTAGNIYTDLTGTCYFTNGSTVVTGSGTSFLSEVNIQRYLKISGHADSAYAPVAEVIDDHYILLDEPYTGATASGTGRSSFWKYNIESGGAITQVSSEILLASGTTSGTDVQAKRYGDYSPFVISFRARITQRIANQEAHIGLADGDIGDMQNQALVVFDGTTNTTVKLRTSSSSSDVETTTVTLPAGLVTSTAAYYQLEVTPGKVVLFINDVRMAEHKLHIPGPYASMDCHTCISNTGVAASSTTLAVDVYLFTNFDRVEIATSPKGDPISSKELRASSSAVTSVAAAVADTLLLTTNASRLGAAIVNDGDSILYLKLGSGASNTSYTVRMTSYAYYEVPFGYTGQINGYWAVALGSARVTEVQ